MRRISLLVLGALVLVVAFTLLTPRLVPTYLYYELLGRRLAPLPPDVERYVVQSGEEYCGRGHDTDCGGYRVTGGYQMVLEGAQARDVDGAWCVDYVLLRRNLGRTGGLIYWANIPYTMVVTRSTAGQYDAVQVEDCGTVGFS